MQSWQLGQLAARCGSPADAELISLGIPHHDEVLIVRGPVDRRSSHPHEPVHLRIDRSPSMFRVDVTRTDEDIEMEPILHRLRFGNTVEEHTRTYSRRIERGAPSLVGFFGLGLGVGLPALVVAGLGNPIVEHFGPEDGETFWIDAVDVDLDSPSHYVAAVIVSPQSKAETERYQRAATELNRADS